MQKIRLWGPGAWGPMGGPHGGPRGMGPHGGPRGMGQGTPGPRDPRAKGPGANGPQGQWTRGPGGPRAVFKDAFGMVWFYTFLHVFTGFYNCYR